VLVNIFTFNELWNVTFCHKTRCSGGGFDVGDVVDVVSGELVRVANSAKSKQLIASKALMTRAIQGFTQFYLSPNTSHTCLYSQSQYITAL